MLRFVQRLVDATQIVQCGQQEETAMMCSGHVAPGLRDDQPHGRLVQLGGLVQIQQCHLVITILAARFRPATVAGQGQVENGGRRNREEPVAAGGRSVVVVVVVSRHRLRKLLRDLDRVIVNELVGAHCSCSLVVGVNHRPHELVQLATKISGNPGRRR